MASLRIQGKQPKSNGINVGTICVVWTHPVILHNTNYCNLKANHDDIILEGPAGMVS
jgi:hypothetical protein